MKISHSGGRSKRSVIVEVGHEDQSWRSVMKISYGHREVNSCNTVWFMQEMLLPEK
jgi:hypothetical protein